MRGRTVPAACRYKRTGRGSDRAPKTNRARNRYTAAMANPESGIDRAAAWRADTEAELDLREQRIQSQSINVGNSFKERTLTLPATVLGLSFLALQLDDQIKDELFLRLSWLLLAGSLVVGLISNLVERWVLIRRHRAAAKAISQFRDNPTMATVLAIASKVKGHNLIRVSVELGYVFSVVFFVSGLVTLMIFAWGNL